ncbi:hypothetical protein Tsubulata_938807 [Turnera subulata]|uniref:Cytochrome P450 n=1 Tax=Turnera subulata TaxID=218843 RepID=A0A9Q0FN17_9ROSI|nr:hypothetical protein Tsubulata_938807 [Turnera subulata]
MDPYQQLITAAVFASLVILYFLVFQRSKTPKKRDEKEAPEPAGAWPIIGHFHLFGGADQLLHHKLAEIADKYGSTLQLRLGSLRGFVVSSREVAKECYTIHDKAFASRPTTTATKLMCYNHAVFGFGPYNSYWREMRKIVAVKFLSGHRLEMLKLVQVSEVDRLIKKLYNLWVGNDCLPVLVDLKQMFRDLSLSVIVKVVAGKDYADSSNEEEAKRCHQAISDFFHLMGASVVSDAFPFLWWLDLQGLEQAMKKTAKEFDSIFGGWLDEHRRGRVSGETKEEGEQEDFVDLLLSLEDRPSLLSGGSDTMPTALTWAVSLLLNNSLTLKKAQEELDLQVGKQRKVAESDIKNLVYIQAIIKETFRLYPVVPLSGPREAIEDCIVDGYRVRKGTRLMVNIWKIQRDPMYWKDPLAFQPERFLTTNADIDVRGQHFELLPFGSGRRSCPGGSFSLQALHLTLARLLHSFDLKTSGDFPIDMTETPGVNVPKATPLQILIPPRLPTELYM